MCTHCSDYQTRWKLGSPKTNKDGGCGRLTKQTERGHSNLPAGVKALEGNLSETSSRENCAVLALTAEHLSLLSLLLSEEKVSLKQETAAN